MIIELTIRGVTKQKRKWHPHFDCLFLTISLQYNKSTQMIIAHPIDRQIFQYISLYNEYYSEIGNKQIMNEQSTFEFKGSWKKMTPIHKKTILIWAGKLNIGWINLNN